MNRRGVGAVVAVLVLLPTVGAAQPTNEVEVGAGFHLFNEWIDFPYLPTGPTVHAAAGRWLNDRWGLSGRFTMTIADSSGIDGVVRESHRLIIANLMIRYRLGSSRKWHIGTGLGKITDKFDVEILGLPTMIVEVMFTQPWTDTIDIRYGVQSIPLKLATLNPMLTFVWKFGQR